MATTLVPVDSMRRGDVAGHDGEEVGSGAVKEANPSIYTPSSYPERTNQAAIKKHRINPQDVCRNTWPQQRSKRRPEPST